MSEKLAEVYEQYDMEILSVRKGRGATILTTTDGLRILEPFRGNMTRLEQEYVLKKLFVEEGFVNVDVIIPNRDEKLFTCDKYRQPFVLKKHFDGEECRMAEAEDIIRATRILAIFHTCGKEVAKLFPAAWERSKEDKRKKWIEEVKKALEDGEEMEKIAFLYGIRESVLEEILKLNIVKEESELDNAMKRKENSANIGTKENEFENTEENKELEIMNTVKRHNLELKKIRKFVGRVKKKNAFENLFLQVFHDYYEQGMTCENMLEEVVKKRKEEVEKTYGNHFGICHGSYNQHNVILNENGEAIVHFERFSRGNQLDDLYQFARKAMEKNHFDFKLLVEMLETYGKVIPLSKEDYHYIYIMFAYPEKFWKIANGYYNANKAFLSPKYMEKLENVILQENEKRKMLLEFLSFQES